MFLLLCKRSRFTPIQTTDKIIILCFFYFQLRDIWYKAVQRAEFGSSSSFRWLAAPLPCIIVVRSSSIPPVNSVKRKELNVLSVWRQEIVQVRFNLCFRLGYCLAYYWRTVVRNLLVSDEWYLVAWVKVIVCPFPCAVTVSLNFGFTAKS